MALLLLVIPAAAGAHPNLDCPEGRPRCRDLTAVEQETLADLLRTAERLLPVPADAPKSERPRPGTIDAKLARRAVARQMQKGLALSPFDKCLPFGAGCFVAPAPMSWIGLRRASRPGASTEYVDPDVEAQAADLLLRVDLDIKAVEYCPARPVQGQPTRESAHVLIERGSSADGIWIALRFGPQACDEDTRPLNESPPVHLAPVRQLTLSVRGRAAAEVERLAARVDRKKVLEVLAQLAKPSPGPKH